MKIGDLVRYKLYPHSELYGSGMTGVTLSMPYVCSDLDHPEMIVDIIWSDTRPQAEGGITWDYVCELEVISESR